MPSPFFFRSFTAGEISEAYASRADLPVYQAGLRTCRNFIVTRAGGVDNRGGTVFVAGIKVPANDATRLLCYTHETPGESILIELGANYFRFFQNGAAVVIATADFPAYAGGTIYTPGQVVTDSGAYYIAIAATTGNAPTDATKWAPLTATDDDGNIIYEVPHPFDFPLDTKWVQSGRVITFVHQSTRPRDLTYVAADEWRLEAVETVVGASVPENPAVVQDPNTVDLTFAVRGHTGADSGNLSSDFTDTFAPPSGGQPVTLTWDNGGSDPDYYEVYKKEGGSYYLVGTASPSGSGGSFDFSDQPLGDPFTPGTGGGLIDTPDNLDATQSPTSPTLSTFRYVATAIVAGEESFASDVAQADLETATDGRPHNLSCDAVTDATSYNWYADPNNNGVFGFIGSSGGPTFAYPGAPTPDYAHNPPTDSNFFSGSDFPACVGTYQQRRLFGNRPSAPDGVQGSRTGLPTNFTVSTPLQDSDAISFRLRGGQQHAVRALVTVKDLVIMTDGGGWRSKTAPGVPLTPTNLPFDQDIYVGIHDVVAPVVVGNALVYVQARGRKVAEVKFEQAVEGLAGRDLTVYASDLFDDDTLRAMDYQYDPHSILWACRADGTLLGLTYIPELDALGWHRHDTGATGAFEDVCVVPELNADTLYVLVKRTVNGATTRSIERLTARREGVFVDAAVVYNGVAIASLDGLDHLEGQTVAIVSGGVLRASRVVSGGAVTLGASYTNVIAGLAITADLETLDIDVAGTDLRGREKRVASVGLLLSESSRSFLAGPSADKLTRFAPQQFDIPANLSFSGYVELPITSDFKKPGRVFIRHDQPTPLSVLGLMPFAEVGG